MLRCASDVKQHKEALEALVEASGPPNAPKMFITNDDRVVYHIDGAPGSGQPTKKIPPSSIQSHIFKVLLTF